MRKGRGAGHRVAGPVRYRKPHPFGIFGAFDDSRIGHVDISFGQRHRASQRAEKTQKNRPKAADTTQQRET